MTKRRIIAIAVVVLALVVGVASIVVWQVDHRDTMPGQLERQVSESVDAEQTYEQDEQDEQDKYSDRSELIADEDVESEAQASAAFIDRCMDRLAADRNNLREDLVTCWFSMSNMMPQLAAIAYPSTGVDVGQPRVADPTAESSSRLWSIDIMTGDTVTATLQYWWIPELGVKLKDITLTIDGQALPGQDVRANEAAQVIDSY